MTKNKNLINQQYDEAYISIFDFFEKPFFIEHNELFTEEETAQIVSCVENGLKRLEADNTAQKDLE